VSFLQNPELKCSLSLIEIVDLEDNHLHEIGSPETLQFWKLFENVQTLRLTHNRIENLGSAMFTLSSLGSLDLASNRLKSLPEDLGKLTGILVFKLLVFTSLSTFSFPFLKFFFFSLCFCFYFLLLSSFFLLFSLLI
jgi:Leucine-rich repeat (LRR) protein